MHIIIIKLCFLMVLKMCYVLTYRAEIKKTKIDFTGVHIVSFVFRRPKRNKKGEFRRKPLAIVLRLRHRLCVYYGGENFRWLKPFLEQYNKEITLYCCIFIFLQFKPIFIEFFKQIKTVSLDMVMLFSGVCVAYGFISIHIIKNLGDENKAILRNKVNDSIQLLYNNIAIGSLTAMIFVISLRTIIVELIVLLIITIFR